MRQWNIDELVLLDISDSEKPFEHFRDDYKVKPVSNLLDFINRFGIECSMPLSFGGNIKSFSDIQERISYGADKVVLNSMFFKDSNLIDKASRVYGKQAIVSSIDYKKINNKNCVFIDKGKTNITVS